MLPSLFLETYKPHEEGMVEMTAFSNTSNTENAEGTGMDIHTRVFESS